MFGEIEEWDYVPHSHLMHPQSNALLPLASTQDSFDEVVLKCSPTSASYYIARTWFKLKVVLQ